MTPVDLNKILFLDIETTAQYEEYVQLSDVGKKLWDIKAGFLIKNQETETSESIYNKAAFFAEFGKIVCVSVGYLQGSGGERSLTIKSFCCEEEKELLTELSELLTRWGSKKEHYLCAHNGKEFDFPYVCRRMIVNNICIPPILQLAGKKPWEVLHLDTFELWKFGDRKSYTSLNLLAHVFNIPTPKEDMDGSMVYEVYYKQKNLTRIVEYCQRDVATLAQIFLRMHCEPMIKPEKIEYKQ